MNLAISLPVDPAVWSPGSFALDNPSSMQAAYTTYYQRITATVSKALGALQSSSSSLSNDPILRTFYSMIDIAYQRVGINLPKSASGLPDLSSVVLANAEGIRVVGAAPAQPVPRKETALGLIIGVSIGAAVLGLLLIVGAILLYRRHSRSRSVRKMVVGRGGPSPHKKAGFTTSPVMLLPSRKRDAGDKTAAAVHGVHVASPLQLADGQAVSHISPMFRFPVSTATDAQIPAAGAAAAVPTVPTPTNC
jgi:hypothetical protein